MISYLHLFHGFLNKEKNMLSFLKGKKTFILGTLMFLISVEKYLTGDTTLSQFLTTVQGILGFNGLGFVTLRAALSKIETK